MIIWYNINVLIFNTVTSDNTWLHHPHWNTMTVCGGISTSIYLYNTMLNPLQRGFFSINYEYQKVFWILNHHKFLSDSFEYLCYGSTTIRNILILLVRGPSKAYTSESAVYRRRFWRITTVPAPKGLSVIIKLSNLLISAGKALLHFKRLHYSICLQFTK